MISSPETTTRIRHAGPPLGIVATIFVVLFNAGLYPVTAFGGNPLFPGPGESIDVISAFFQARPSAVLRRTYVLLGPPQEPRFAAPAAMDSGFAQHKALTVTHILPAALFIVLMPLQFIRRIRERRLAWHRWSGRLLVILGFVVGMSALVMSYTMAIGGANETAATTLFALLFLVFLTLGFWNIRRQRIARRREWMIRAFGVVLGIATTRLIVGVFFAAQKLSPHEFFGIAFWLGFTLTLLGAEAWIQHARPQSTALPSEA